MPIGEPVDGWDRGDDITAARMNQLVAMVNSLRVEVERLRESVKHNDPILRPVQVIDKDSDGYGGAIDYNAVQVDTALIWCDTGSGDGAVAQYPNRPGEPSTPGSASYGDFTRDRWNPLSTVGGPVYRRMGDFNHGVMLPGERCWGAVSNQAGQLFAIGGGLFHIGVLAEDLSCATRSDNKPPTAKVNLWTMSAKTSAFTEAKDRNGNVIFVYVFDWLLQDGFKLESGSHVVLRQCPTSRLYLLTNSRECPVAI